LHATGAMEPNRLNSISFLIIEAAIEIHRVVGPGLLESTYRTCMLYELRERGLSVRSEQIVPVRYKNLVLGGGYRLDLIVEDAVIVELKSVEVVLPVHYAQLLSYLRHTDRSLGLLINFNVHVLTKGVKRIRNGFRPL
jgi:GxxExxY protein